MSESREITAPSPTGTITNGMRTMDHPVEPLELTDGAVTIRRYRLEDAEPMYAAVQESREHLAPWLPWCTPAYSLETAREWIVERPPLWDAGAEYCFGIFDALTGRYLGGVGLNKIDRLNRSANLGYWIRSSATRRGIATAATRLATRFGFEAIGLIRIEILAAVGNTASRRVAIKSGAVEEGVLRGKLLLYGVAHDAMMHGIVRGK